MGWKSGKAIMSKPDSAVPQGGFAGDTSPIFIPDVQSMMGSDPVVAKHALALRRLIVRRQSELEKTKEKERTLALISDAEVERNNLEGKMREEKRQYLGRARALKKSLDEVSLRLVELRREARAKCRIPRKGGGKWTDEQRDFLRERWTELDEVVGSMNTDKLEILRNEVEDRFSVKRTANAIYAQLRILLREDASDKIEAPATG